MSRRKKYHDLQLASKLKNYAESRTLDFQQYSEYHMRLMDGGYTTIDFWTTGRYWVMATDYHALGVDKVERSGEKGMLPSNLEAWLDELFFPEGSDG